MKKPMYQVIMDNIMDEIQQISPNTAILSERELAEKYKVSRMTVRRSITELVNLGYLYTSKNKGTFVTDPKLRKTVKGSLVQASKEENEYKILYFDTKQADEFAQEKLQIRPSEYFTKIVRINKKDGIPISLDEIYINSRYLQHENMDAIEFLRKFNDEMKGLIATKIFIPMTLPVKYSNLLRMSIDTPTIKIESTYSDNSGCNYAFIVTYNNPEHTQIKVTL